MPDSFEPPPLPDPGSYQPPLPPGYVEVSNKPKIIMMIVLMVGMVGAVVYYGWSFLQSKRNGLPSIVQTVKLGDTRERVVDIMGKPKGSTLKDGAETMIYENGYIIISNDSVVSVELVKASQMGQISSRREKIILLKGGKIETEEPK